MLAAWSVHGVLLVLLGSLAVAYLGWIVSEREGDTYGVIGYGLGLLALAAGISYLGGW